MSFAYVCTTYLLLKKKTKYDVYLRTSARCEHEHENVSTAVFSVCTENSENNDSDDDIDSTMQLDKRKCYN